MRFALSTVICDGDGGGGDDAEQAASQSSAIPRFQWRIRAVSPCIRREILCWNPDRDHFIPAWLGPHRKAVSAPISGTGLAHGCNSSTTFDRPNGSFNPNRDADFIRSAIFYCSL